MRIFVKGMPVITFISTTVEVPDGTPADGLEAAAKEAILKGNWQRRWSDFDELDLRAYPEQLLPPERWELEVEPPVKR